MFGVILTSIGSFFEEISASIGKNKALKHEESPYTLAFLHLIWGVIIFSVIALVKEGAFLFSPESLPTFITRLFLEIVQVHVAVIALIKTDRSTFGFVRVGTIPLLLLADNFLGYVISPQQAIGIGIIITSLFIAFMNHGIKRKGLGYLLFATINAVFTISLFKYNISNFNSVVAEQLLIQLFLVIYFFFFAYHFAGENPILFLKKRAFFAQSAAQGVGSILDSFAYSFAPASIILAAKRSSAILWATFSGNIYFKERHLIFKLLLWPILVVGILFLVI